MRQMIRATAIALTATALLASPAAASHGPGSGWGHDVHDEFETFPLVPASPDARQPDFYVESPGRDEAHPTGTHRAYHVVWEGEWWV